MCGEARMSMVSGRCEAFGRFGTDAFLDPMIWADTLSKEGS